MGCCTSSNAIHEPLSYVINYEIEKKYSAVVTRVYDGDTIFVNITLGTIKVDEKVVQVCQNDVSIRLNGIDAPEIRCLKSNPLRVKEKQAACKVRDVLSMFFSKYKNNVILVMHKEKDKYGRKLCDVFVEEKDNEHNKNKKKFEGNDKIKNNMSIPTNVCTFLLSNKLVHEYKGKKKLPFTEKELDNIIGEKSIIL
jgi:endonuclease YncB( thermonuclease family)